MIDNIYLTEAKRIRKLYMNYYSNNEFIQNKYKSFQEKLDNLKMIKKKIDKMDNKEKTTLETLLKLNTEIENLLLNIDKENKLLMEQFKSIKVDEEKLYALLKENYKHYDMDDIKNYIIKSIMDEENSK